MISSLIDWPALLRQLSIRVICESPLTAICPTCRKGKLQIYNDTFISRHRFACNGCKATGDILRLVATMTKVPEEYALKKLATLCPPLHARYVESGEAAKRNETIAAVAAHGAAFSCRVPLRILSNQHATNMLSQLSLRVNSSVSWISASLGRIIGYLTAEEFERICRLELPDQSRRPLLPKSYKHVPSGVHGVGIVPLWAGPGVVAAYYTFHAAEGKLHGDVHSFGYRGEQELGLAIHPDIIHAQDPLVLAPGMHTFLDLVNRFCHQTKELPPVVATPRYGERTAQAAGWLAGRKVTLWTPRMLSGTIRQAIRFNCRIHVAGPKEKSNKACSAWLGSKNVPDLLSETHAKGKVWQEALAEQFQKLDRSQISELLQSCNLSQSELQILGQALDPGLRDVVERVADDAWRHAFVPVQSGVVEQRTGKWYHRQSRREPALVTDAPYRIQALYRSDTDPKCVLQVHHEGELFSLTVAHDEFMKSPMRIIQRQMLSEHSRITTYDPTWEKSINHVALQFFKPESVKRICEVGVDSTEQTFRTTQLAVDLTSGRISPTDSNRYGELMPQAVDRVLTPSELARFNRPRNLMPLLVVAAQLRAAATGEMAVHAVVSSRSAVRYCRQFLSLLDLNRADAEAHKLGTPQLVMLQEQYENSKLHKMNLDWTRPLWLAASRDMSDWLCQQSLPATISESYNREWLPSAALAQTAVVQLLAETSKRSERSANSLVATTEAWQRLCARSEATSAISASDLSSAHPIHALGRILERAAAAGDIDLVTKLSTSSLRPQISYASKSPKGWFVPRTTISAVFERLKLPSWDFENLSLRLLECAAFEGQTRRGIRAVWRFRESFMQAPDKRATIAVRSAESA